MLQLGADQRDRLMMTTERINQSGGRIKESRRQLVETEELGVHILQDLQLQHQTLLHTQQTVGIPYSLPYSKLAFWIKVLITLTLIALSFYRKFVVILTRRCMEWTTALQRADGC